MEQRGSGAKLILGKTLPAAAIFDLDGTLRDTLAVRYEVLREVSRRTGARVLSLEEVKEVMKSPGPPWEYMVPQGLSAEEQASFVRQFAEINAEFYPKLYARKVTQIPGALDAVEKLARAGVKLCVVSSSTVNEETAPPWEKRIYELAQVVITRARDPHLRPKPAPDTMVACLDRLRVTAHQVLCVGDAPADIQAGKAAGTFTIGVLTGISDQPALEKEGPDLILMGPSELVTRLAL